MQGICVAYSISSVAETRDRALSFSRRVDITGCSPVAFLANGVFIVTRVGFELTTRVTSPHAVHNEAPFSHFGE